MVNLSPESRNRGSAGCVSGILENPPHVEIAPSLMRLNRVFLTTILALACSQAALPQKYEIAPVFAAKRMSSEDLGSLNDTAVDNDTRFRKSSTGIGLRLTRNTKGYYGHEISYILNRAKVRSLIRTEDSNGNDVETQREGKADIHELYYNFMMYMMPSGEFFRPYITVGMQYAQYNKPKIPEWDFLRTRNFGFNYGGGIKLNVAKHLLVRADFRHAIGGKPYDLRFAETSSTTGIPSSKSGGMIGQLEGSVGIGITF